MDPKSEERMRLKFLIKNRFLPGWLLCLAICPFAFAQQQADNASLFHSVRDPLSDCNIAEIDRQMDAIIDKIKVEYADDQLFLKKLDEAQSAWEAYREAFLLSVYPEEDARAMYGSVFDACWCFRYTAKTEERIKELQMWLDKVEEGDVCSGSVRFK